MRRLQLTVSPALAGQKVGTLLRKELSLSGSAVRRAKTIEDGILLDGEPVFTNVSAAEGQVLSVAVGDVFGNADIPPVEGPLDIRYEDEDILLINKDGYTPVHPSQGHHGDTLANFLMAHYERIGLTAAFHPVNRLDRGTSGIMAVAKHPHAHERLQEQLRQGILNRSYLAVCEGVPQPFAGEITQPIRRVPDSVLMREVSPFGDFARTRYRVLETGRGRSLLHLTLETGRTHQIRVHMAYLGCPLVGDFLYGKETDELPDRFALHSYSITLRQPVTNTEISRTVPLPPELKSLLGVSHAE